MTFICNKWQKWSIDIQTFVHQRSWWEIVSITVKIANIHYIICTYLTVSHFKRLCGLKSHQWSSCYSPMPKFLGLFSNRGFTTFLASCFLATEGAGATFFPLAFFPLGYEETQHYLIWVHKQQSIQQKQHFTALAQFKRWVLHNVQVKKFKSSLQKPQKTHTKKQCGDMRCSNFVAHTI